MFPVLWIILHRHISVFLPLSVGTVDPEDLATAELEFTPTAPGKRKLVINFSSDKLSNVHGYVNITIEE